MSDSEVMGGRLIQLVAQRAFQLAEGLLTRSKQFHINRANVVPEESAFSSEFVQLVDRLKLDDIGLTVDKLLAYNQAQMRPVMFMEVMEVPQILNISAIALMTDKTNIPLHDHPGMHGCIKVLHGQVHLEAFTVLNSASDKPLSYWAEQHCDQLITPTDKPMVIGPKVGNLHRITAVGGPAVFFDVLMPTYEPPERDCRYFQEILANSRLQLVEIPVPRSYRTGLLHYAGPNINLFA